MRKSILCLLLMLILCGFLLWLFRDQLQGAYATFQASLAQLQNQLKAVMTSLARQLRSGNRSVAGLLMALAFLYGVIHSAGPGHGKMVIVSYLLARKGGVRRAVIISALAAGLHGVSAITVVLIIHSFVSGRLSRVFSAWSEHLQIVAYVVISVLGLILLTSKIREIVTWKEDRKPDRPIGWMVLALGLVPCPGTMIVLLFFMSLNLLLWGIGLALLMTLGMMFTLTVIGIIVAFSQKMFPQTDTHSKGRFAFVGHSVSILGSMAILIFGLVMLQASLVSG